MNGGQQVLAHGVSGRQDLPIPFSFALTGAAVALAASFVVLGLLWRTSKLHGDTAGRPLPAAAAAVADHPALRWALRTLGLAAAAFVAAAAVFGPDDRRNPAPGFVYVVFWVGLVPASLLFGPVWKLLNPLRTLHRGLAALAGLPPEAGFRAYPPRLGYWPAAAGLLAFTWLELVSPDRTANSTLLLWFGTYGTVQLLGAMVYGSRWFDHGDAFEVYSALVGRLAPLGRRGDGRLVVRNPLDGLDGLRPAPGLAAVVCVLLGSTGYDSFSSSLAWADLLRSTSPVLMGTLGLVGAVLLATGLFTAVAEAAAAPGAAAAPETAGGPPAAFAHSLVPIAVGYLVAHYFSLALFEGQRTLILASDPFDSGANLFGTAGRGVDYALVSATTIATVQVLAVVTGHILGTVAAHDRAVRLFPPRHAVTGQLPLLAVMVAFTVGGLSLLFTA
jgi:hypothetical protein